MRRSLGKIDYMQSNDATFDSLYADYSAMCRDEGIEPLTREDLLHVLRAVAMFNDGEESVTLH